MAENQELKKARQAVYRAKKSKELAEKNKTYRDNLPPAQATASNAQHNEVNRQRYHDTCTERKTAKLAAPAKKHIFTAIDGEAHREDDGRSVYSYLRASGMNPLVARKGLKTVPVLEYLFRIPPGSTIVGFVLNYDWENWLCDIPDEAYKYLTGDNDIIPDEGAEWDRTIRTYKDGSQKLIQNSITWQGYTLSYYPRKIFTVMKMGYNGKPRMRRILDVWGYCQGSFLKACEDWQVATRQELAPVAEGKGKRDGFTWAELEYTAQYNQAELDLMVKLAENIFAGVDEACRLADLPIRPAPGDLYGPGAIARKIMKEIKWPDDIGKNPIPAEKKDVYLETVSQADDIQKNYLLHYPIIASYFGGRIEAAATGRFKKVYDYDLHGAYPSAITRLPYIPDGHMTWRDYKNPQAGLFAAADLRAVGMYYCMWNFPASWQWYPFPTRQKRNQNVYYPRDGQGWITSPEFFAALETVPNVEKHILVYHSWTLDGTQWEKSKTYTGYGAGNKPLPEEDKSPIAKIIEKMYLVRAAAKKAKLQGAQLALKLILNSLYGKLLQQVGVTLDKPGLFHDLVAAWITSWTRSAIWRGVAPHRTTKTVVAIQTDGIVTKKELDLPLSPDLGQWEVETLPDYRQLLPGLYDYQATDKRKERRRGMPKAFDFETAWNVTNTPGAVYTFKYRTFLAKRLFLAQPFAHAGQCYQWPDFEKTFRPDLGAKRGNPFADLPAGGKFGDCYLADGKREKWLLPKTNLQQGAGYPFKLKFDVPSYIPVEEWEIEVTALENSQDESFSFFRE